MIRANSAWHATKYLVCVVALLQPPKWPRRIKMAGKSGFRTATQKVGAKSKGTMRNVPGQSGW